MKEITTDGVNKIRVEETEVLHVLRNEVLVGLKVAELKIGDLLVLEAGRYRVKAVTGVPTPKKRR